MKVRDIEKILKSDGWFHARTQGGHKHFKHPTKKGIVTVPQHKGDLKLKTANSIFEQAGIEKPKK